MTSLTDFSSAAALALTAAHRESETRTERIFLAIGNHLVDHDRAGSVTGTSPADIASGKGEQAG